MRNFKVNELRSQSVVHFVLSHCPTPWTVEEREDGWYEIDHSGMGGLECRLSKEDAEFIVRACNSHEDLLEACKAILWRATWDGAPQADLVEDCTREMVIQALAKALCVELGPGDSMVEIRQAIEKAEGG